MALFNGLHALENKFLNAFAFIGFGGVDIILRVGCYAVGSVELARLSSAATKTNQHLQGLAINNINLEVLAIS